MPDTEMTRLTISWSAKTDLALRSYLGSQGLKKGALSSFIEDAVKWRLFDRSVEEARAALSGVPAAEIERTVAEAVREVRRQKRKRRGAGKER